jgi:hypothetical protein
MNGPGQRPSSLVARRQFLKTAGRAGLVTRASAWDPPVLDPRLTNSVGLSQIATLTSNRLVRFPF